MLPILCFMLRLLCQIVIYKAGFAYNMIFLMPAVIIGN